MARREVALVGIQRDMIGNLRIPRLVLVVFCAALAISIVVGLWMAGALVSSGWWGDFWANFVADAVVALAFGLLLARYLRRGEEAHEEEERRTEALALLRKEVKSNIEIAARAIERIPKGDIIYPLFNTSVGDTIYARGVLAGADVALQTRIAAMYDTLHSIN